MTDQFSFAEFAPARHVDCLFFAVLPDEQTAARLIDVQTHLVNRHRLRGKLMEPDRLHVTLRLVGNYDGLRESVVDEAKRAADSIVMAPFDVAFSHAATLGGEAFALFRGQGSDALVALGDAIGVAMAKVGLKSSASQFKTPHISLLRAPSRVPEEPVEPVHWTASEFVLIHSLIGKHEHRIKARWPLLPNA